VRSDLTLVQERCFTAGAQRAQRINCFIWRVEDSGKRRRYPPNKRHPVISKHGFYPISDLLRSSWSYPAREGVYDPIAPLFFAQTPQIFSFTASGSSAGDNIPSLRIMEKFIFTNRIRRRKGGASIKL